jgi:DNA-binding response OmpR family regulator
MHVAKRVLSVSNDESLLKTRHHMLEKAGYQVVSAYGLAEAMQHFQEQPFDLVLLGHTLPQGDQTALIAKARETCPCPVLSIRLTHESPHPDADYSVDASDGPEALMQSIRTALRAFSRGP